MRVTVVGAGKMGRAIATRALAGGHEVEILARDPNEARSLAEELGGTALGPDDPFGGELVVLAVYYPGIVEAAREYGDRLAGRIVVDISNPVDTQTWDRLATEPGSSSAEEVARALPAGTPVLKAFNTNFGNVLVNGEAHGQKLDVLIAGDDEDAKQKLSQLVSDAGMRPLDAGALHRARQLEELGLLHITMQEPNGFGFESIVKFHP